MSRITADDQLRFLLSCVKHANNGKIDFVEVAGECGIISKGAAAKRYERLLKTNGLHSSVTDRQHSTAAREKSKTAIAKAAAAKRKKIEGDQPAINEDYEPKNEFKMLKTEIEQRFAIKDEPALGYASALMPVQLPATHPFQRSFEPIPQASPPGRKYTAWPITYSDAPLYPSSPIAQRQSVRPRTYHQEPTPRFLVQHDFRATNPSQESTLFSNSVLDAPTTQPRLLPGAPPKINIPLDQVSQSLATPVSACVSPIRDTLSQAPGRSAAKSSTSMQEGQVPEMKSVPPSLQENMPKADDSEREARHRAQSPIVSASQDLSGTEDRDYILIMD